MGDLETISNWNCYTICDSIKLMTRGLPSDFLLTE
jgi:hypothetical protein